jgi:hypothetical protein
MNSPRRCRADQDGPPSNPPVVTRAGCPTLPSSRVLQPRASPALKSQLEPLAMKNNRNRQVILRSRRPIFPKPTISKSSSPTFPICVGDLALRLDVLVATKPVFWIVSGLHCGKPGVVLGIGFGDSCHVILIEAVHVSGTGRPWLHSAVKSARPIYVTSVFLRVGPRAD